MLATAMMWAALGTGYSYLADETPRFVQPPLQAYLHAADRQRALHPDPANPPCTVKTSDHGHDELRAIPTGQCYRMTPPYRMRGVWVDEYEGSRFYPGRTRRPAFKLTTR